MFRSKPPRHSSALSTGPDSGRRIRPPWRRIKSGAESVQSSIDPPASSASSESGVPVVTSSAGSSSASHASRPHISPLKRLSSLFREGDGRSEENLRSLKMRVIQVRRQPDGSPIRFQLGFRSRTGWEPIRASKANQDCLVALVPWGPGSAFNLFGALDGHGRNGHQCAIFIAEKMVSYLGRTLQENAHPDAIVATMHKAVMHAERRLEAHASIVDFQLSGSTGVFVLVKGTTLFCANVGDSRAVIGREDENNSRSEHLSQGSDASLLIEAGVALPPVHPPKNSDKKRKARHIPSRPVAYVPVALSIDQRPSRPDEKARLLAAGARVDAWEGVGEGEERVWLPEARTPGLAVSRTFGDLLVKDYGVTCVPEVYSMELSADDRFLIMASDGVFEFISSQEVVNLVGKCRDHGTAQEAAEEVVKLAWQRWIDDDSVIDDISCVVVYMDVLAPEVSGPRDPILLDASCGVQERVNDVGHSRSARTLNSSRSWPDGLELITRSSADVSLHKELKKSCSLDIDVDASARAGDGLFGDDHDGKHTNDSAEDEIRSTEGQGTPEHEADDEEFRENRT